MAESEVRRLPLSRLNKGGRTVWAAAVKVRGWCPVGCGQTLVLGEAGAVVCSSFDCPRPAAPDELLGDDETEHLVVLRDDEFTVRHPLRERLDDALDRCQLVRLLVAEQGPPRPVGRYRVVVPDPADTDVISSGWWEWERIGDV